ncbi:MAG: hypothetical protein K2Q21_01995 [Chitinophagaceae bacterium]|nr:hypothetical protein [Chitinophagaceae bacterium]
MKTLITTFLLLLCTYFLHAQTEVKKEYWLSKKLKSETTYLNGIKNGKEIIYSYWGDKESETNWVNGLKQGVQKNYYKGNIQSEIPFVNGKEEGLALYYDGKGRLRNDELWENGKIKCRDKEYYTNGNLLKECPCVDGKNNGVYKRYFQNSQVWEETQMHDDQYNGTYKLYYDNGTLIKEYNYIEGKRNGICKDFNEKGVLQVSQTFANDVLDGASKLYTDRGVIYNEIIYVNGIQNGKYKLYDKEGRIKSEELFINGISKETNYFNEEGYLTSTQLHNAEFSDEMFIVDTTSKKNARKESKWEVQYTNTSRFYGDQTHTIKSAKSNTDIKVVDIEAHWQKDTEIEYEGYVVNGVREGMGKLYYHSASGNKDDDEIYVGMFKNGLPNGYGYMRPRYTRKIFGNPENEKYDYGYYKDGKYVGEYQNMELVTYTNGNTYYGQFTSGKYQGKGTLTCKEQTIIVEQNDGTKTYVLKYEGYWKEGKMHGHGFCDYADKTTYFGNFINGKREGEGSLLSYEWKKSKMIKHELKGIWVGDKFIK